MRPFAQPAFVDEDDGAPLAERFFLSCGQRYRFQYRIACSSRSNARPLGRWQAPAQLAQDAPDVGLVIAHLALVLDEFAHPTRGPQPGGIAQRLGTALESLFELVELGRAQLGLAPCATDLLQTRAPQFSMFT